MLVPLLILSLADNLSSPQRLPWRWEVPAECPDGGELHRRVEHEYGGRSAANLAVSVSIVRDRQRYSLSGEIALDGFRQQVELHEGPNCDLLVSKFLLFVASLDPDPDPARTRTRSGLPRHFEGYTRVAGEAEIGTLCPGSACERTPLPAWGGVFAGGWIRSRLRVELAATLHTAASRVLAAERAGFGELTMRWIRTGARVRACGALERTRFDLLLCGEVGLQLLFGLPSPEAASFEVSTPVLVWGSVRLVSAFVWWMHLRVGLRLELAPGVNLHPNDYQVYDQIKGEAERRPLAEIGRLHAAFGVGLDVRLGGRTRR